MGRVLRPNFYDAPSVDVARNLLGQMLCRRLDSGKIVRAPIAETEAYDGFEDKASHAHRGLTTRNAPMFGPPGRAYVYLCYGVHWLLNLTTREKNYPAAVLIRGVVGINGPGRVSRHFKVGGSYNGRPLTRVSGLWVEEGPRVAITQVESKPRVGIDYAGSEWAAMPWRFCATITSPDTKLPSCAAQRDRRGQRDRR